MKMRNAGSNAQFWFLFSFFLGCLSFGETNGLTAKPCPDGWTHIGNKCLQIYKETASQSEASRKCQAKGKGSTLAKPAVEDLDATYAMFKAIREPTWVGYSKSEIPSNWWWLPDQGNENSAVCTSIYPGYTTKSPTPYPTTKPPTPFPTQSAPTQPPTQPPVTRPTTRCNPDVCQPRAGCIDAYCDGDRCRQVCKSVLENYKGLFDDTPCDRKLDYYMCEMPMPLCPSKCSPVGHDASKTCTATNTCECFPGFEGDDCGITNPGKAAAFCGNLSLPYDLSIGGRCVCVDGVYGEKCDQFSSPNIESICEKLLGQATDERCPCGHRFNGTRCILPSDAKAPELSCPDELVLAGDKCFFAVGDSALLDSSESSFSDAKAGCEYLGMRLATIPAGVSPQDFTSAVLAKTQQASTLWINLEWFDILKEDAFSPSSAAAFADKPSWGDGRPCPITSANFSSDARRFSQDKVSCITLSKDGLFHSSACRTSSKVAMVCEMPKTLRKCPAGRILDPSSELCVLPAEETTPQCAQGWKELRSGQCFKPFETSMEHTDAKTACGRLGGILASPHSREEFLKINSTLSAGNSYHLGYVPEAKAWADGTYPTFPLGDSSLFGDSTLCLYASFLGVRICSGSHSHVCQVPASSCQENWILLNGRCIKPETTVGPLQGFTEQVECGRRALNTTNFFKGVALLDHVAECAERSLSGKSVSTKTAEQLRVLAKVSANSILSTIEKANGAVGPLSTWTLLNGLSRVPSWLKTLRLIPANSDATAAFMDLNHSPFSLCSRAPCPCRHVWKKGTCTESSDVAELHEAYAAYSRCGILPPDVLVERFSLIPAENFISHAVYCLRELGSDRNVTDSLQEALDIVSLRIDKLGVSQRSLDLFKLTRRELLAGVRSASSTSQVPPYSLRFGKDQTQRYGNLLGTRADNALTMQTTKRVIDTAIQAGAALNQALLDIQSGQNNLTLALSNLTGQIADGFSGVLGQWDSGTENTTLLAQLEASKERFDHLVQVADDAVSRTSAFALVAQTSLESGIGGSVDKLLRVRYQFLEKVGKFEQAKAELQAKQEIAGAVGVGLGLLIVAAASTVGQGQTAYKAIFNGPPDIGRACQVTDSGDENSEAKGRALQGVRSTYAGLLGDLKGLVSQVEKGRTWASQAQNLGLPEVRLTLTKDGFVAAGSKRSDREQLCRSPIQVFQCMLPSSSDLAVTVSCCPSFTVDGTWFKADCQALTCAAKDAAWVNSSTVAKGGQQRYERCSQENGKSLESSDRPESVRLSCCNCSGLALLEAKALFVDKLKEWQVRAPDQGDHTSRNTAPLDDEASLTTETQLSFDGCLNGEKSIQAIVSDSMPNLISDVLKGAPAPEKISGLPPFPQQKALYDSLYRLSAIFSELSESVISLVRAIAETMSPDRAGTVPNSPKTSSAIWISLYNEIMDTLEYDTALCPSITSDGDAAQRRLALSQRYGTPAHSHDGFRRSLSSKSELQEGMTNLKGQAEGLRAEFNAARKQLTLDCGHFRGAVLQATTWARASHDTLVGVIEEIRKQRMIRFDIGSATTRRKKTQTAIETTLASGGELAENLKRMMRPIPDNSFTRGMLLAELEQSMYSTMFQEELLEMRALGENLLTDLCSTLRYKSPGFVVSKADMCKLEIRDDPKYQALSLASLSEALRTVGDKVDKEMIQEYVENNGEEHDAQLLDVSELVDFGKFAKTWQTEFSLTGPHPAGESSKRNQDEVFSGAFARAGPFYCDTTTKIDNIEMSKVGVLFFDENGSLLGPSAGKEVLVVIDIEGPFFKSWQNISLKYEMPPFRKLAFKYHRPNPSGACHSYAFERAGEACVQYVTPIDPDQRLLPSPYAKWSVKVESGQEFLRNVFSVQIIADLRGVGNSDLVCRPPINAYRIGGGDDSSSSSTPGALEPWMTALIAGVVSLVVCGLLVKKVWQRRSNKTGTSPRRSENPLYGEPHNIDQSKVSAPGLFRMLRIRSDLSQGTREKLAKALGFPDEVQPSGESAPQAESSGAV